MHPKNCVLAFGIPTSLDDFNAKCQLDESFVRQFHDDEDRFKHQFLYFLKEIEPKWLELGVHVAHRVTLAQFAEFLKAGTYQVIILFSHNSKKLGVEFHDGFATVGEIVECVPQDFTDILDMSVCQTDTLSKTLNFQRPLCRQKQSSIELVPYNWLEYYLLLFQILEQNHINYDSALRILNESYFKAIDRRNMIGVQDLSWKW